MSLCVPWSEIDVIFYMDIVPSEEILLIALAREREMGRLLYILNLLFSSVRLGLMETAIIRYSRYHTNEREDITKIFYYMICHIYRSTI